MPSPSNEQQSKVSATLGFAVYAAARTVTGAYRRALKPLGLTFPQYLVLVVLSSRDGATVSDIGNELRLETGTLTPVLKRLEADGVVSRQRSRIDEREVEIWLTQRGRGLLDRVADAHQGVERLFAMSETDSDKLRDELLALIQRLDSAGP